MGALHLVERQVETNLLLELLLVPTAVHEHVKSMLNGVEE